MQPVEIYTSPLRAVLPAAKRPADMKKHSFAEVETYWLTQKPQSPEMTRVPMAAHGAANLNRDTHVGGCDDLYALGTSGKPGRVVGTLMQAGPVIS